MDLYVHKVLKWDKTPRKEDKEVELYWKSITEAERHAASTHCGPHESYPLGPGCKHVPAAFTLAMSGHGSPNMSCIRNYAKRHGCGTPPSQKALNMWEPEPFNSIL